MDINTEIVEDNDEQQHKKKRLGQFYTTNYDYILQNLYIPDDVSIIIEPFAGQGNLLDFIINKENYTIESYDLDPKLDFIIKRDTLKEPPCYDNKFILTNPPFLARNKNKDKTLYDKYKCNDLYKCFLENIINSSCLGGIIILPLNFISSIRINDIKLRKRFIEKFDIIKINIFEEQVFSDTSYTVCSIQFKKKINQEDNTINCSIYPSNKNISFILNNDNNFTIGGEIYNLPINNNYTVERATKLTIENEDEEYITNILLKAIDNNIDNKINLKLVDFSDIYIDDTENLSARSYASLVIKPKINKVKQEELIEKFNEYLNDNREKYNSLFLANYRNSNNIARKRISFTLAFKICSYLLNE